MWAKELKEQILDLRDTQDKTFSEICEIMQLTQAKARSLYASAKISKRNEINKSLPPISEGEA